MLIIFCIPCSLAIRVLPQVKENLSELETLVGRLSDFWPDRYPCPRCEKMMRGMPESSVEPRVLKVMDLKDLTPAEAFAAFSGLGFPDEHICTLEALHELFTEHPVRKLHGMNVRGSERSVIEAIELWDGTKIYLGGSPDGAVVYRVSRPRPTPERLGLLEEGTHE